MENLFLFVALIILIICLVISARFVETSFTVFSKKFKINEFFLGFFVLAVITSLPEISIAVVSSNEAPDLSLGNLIGSSIVVLTLIMGISAIKYKGIEFKGKFSEKDVVMGLLLISLMVFSIVDGYLTILESMVLLGAYALYIYYLYKKFNKKDSVTLFVTIDSTSPIRLFIKAMVGIVGIIITSSFVVSTASTLATNVGVSTTLIGVLMLAVGTNLPELTVLLTSKNLNEEKLAIGNFFGSVCLNVPTLALLGIMSRGFKIDDLLSIVSGSVILIFSIILFMIFSWTGRKLSRSEGILLLAIYAAFILTELLVLITTVK